MKQSSIALVLILLLPCSVFAQPKEGVKVRVSYSVISAASLVTWVAKDAGIFRKHGLDVDLIYIGSATKAVSATISGDTPITQGAGTGSVLARLSGADTVWVGSILDTTNQSLVVVPAIRTPQDLRGKTLGVTRFGSLSDFGVRKYLQTVGLGSRGVRIERTHRNPIEVKIRSRIVGHCVRDGRGVRRVRPGRADRERIGSQPLERQLPDVVCPVGKAGVIIGIARPHEQRCPRPA